MADNIYGFSVKKINGETIHLSEYNGMVLLIVNTASNCGFTNQYEGLQKLYEKYSGDGFAVLGFPSNQFANQEPGTDAEINSFCSVNYGVSFPMFSKINVNGIDAHPLFNYLKKKSPGFLTRDIKWNFTKFLIDRRGNVVKRFGPATAPEKIEKYIKKLL